MYWLIINSGVSSYIGRLARSKYKRFSMSTPTCVTQKNPSCYQMIVHLIGCQCLAMIDTLLTWTTNGLVCILLPTCKPKKKVNNTSEILSRLSTLFHFSAFCSSWSILIIKHVLYDGIIKDTRECLHN
jgi:hypothetical protein